MSHATDAASAANKISWARARVLSQLTGIKPQKCRSYLARCSWDITTLDPGTKGLEYIDPKSRHIKTMTKEVQLTQLKETYQPKETHQPQRTPIRNTTRTAHGDPTQPPRAGAPQTNGHTTAPITLLVQLKQLQETYHITTTELANCVEALGQLTNDPIDLTQFTKEIKETRRRI